MPLGASSKSLHKARLSLPSSAAIKAACSGDPRAQEALIQQYQGRVAGFVISQTGDDAHYEDLCQTIFIKMVLGLPGLKAPRMFEAWLFKIARNVCMDHQRRRLGWRRLFVAYEPQHDSVAEIDSSEDEDRLDAMTHALRQLPSAQRELLGLAFERNRSYEELAKISGLSTPALKSRLFRARESLRRILGKGTPRDDC
jgi:RNA polymerase sigma-70 factor (ECF subfamily)